MEPSGDSVTKIFFNGTVMRGQPAHENIAGADFIREAATAPEYRIHSIDDSYPGMYHVGEGGISVPGELYEAGDEVLAEILETEPPHLYMGDVLLDSGEWVQGMLCPEEIARTKPDISGYGGWKAYIDGGAKESSN